MKMKFETNIALVDDRFNFGLVDNRFLARSIGLLDPSAPVTLNENDTLEQALAILKQNRIGCVVITGEDGTLAGIFTERDVVLKLDYQNLQPDLPLSKLMTPDPQRVEMTAPIAFVLQLMSEGGFRHVPIVDDEGLPVGIVSVKDIVDYVVQSALKDLDALEKGDPAD